MLTAYTENPTNCRFEGQDADEKILLLLRAHPITNLPWIILSIFIFFLPFILPNISMAVGFSFSQLPDTLITAMIVINYLLVLVIVFEGFLEWYFNVNLLTNKRLIDIDFESVLFKNVDQAPLNSVQEASGSVGGILGLIFHFGDVFIQTAGAKVSIDLHNVPNPSIVADKIIDVAHGS